MRWWLRYEEQRVKLKTGAVLVYDYLIVATGSTHSYFGTRTGPSWRRG
jgi:NADH dehydrogenase FAD-containing subunit